ncbi:MAG: 2-oxo acid dehydrogenase subunit E2 [Flavobacteriaceae bacterium]|nr:2-oxo acid dehydrogenase subunit E2 [Flavobacteriaceae bacterium]
MPKLGESITEAAIIKWFKNVGDTIEEDEILLEVATDKVDSEVPSLVTGVVSEILYKQNDVIKIGETIAIIKTDGKTAVKKEETTQIENVNPIKKKASKKQSVSVKGGAFKVANSNLFFSPLIVSIAKEHHISFEELARISASGNKNRLRKSDLMSYIEEGRPFKFAQPVVEKNGFQIPDLKFDKGTGKIVEMDRMRQMIADRMVFSKHTSPHVTAYVEADLTNMVEWRNKMKVPFLEKYNQKLTFTPLFIEAVAKAIVDYPMINSSLDGKNIIVKEDINIGMAAALPSGNLIVPVVKNADKKNLVELATDINSLAVKARENKLKTDDLSGSTFTISNVGTFGSVMGTPIINQPEAAILATGIIKKRAEVIERPDGDSIEIRSMMYLSLSFDHRIVDGFLAGSFLRRIGDYMEKFDINRKI